MDIKFQYYTAPIELYRNFLDKPQKVLNDVLEYQIANFENIDEAEELLQVRFGDRKLCAESCKRLHKVKYCGVMFSIPRTLYWDYHDNNKTEWDYLRLLAYLSLKSMIGRKDIWKSNAGQMFARMAGYAGLNAYKNRESKGVGKIGSYMKNDRCMTYYSEKLRLSLMDDFNEFHSYSVRGKRGFVFMFSTNSRKKCFKTMADYMEKTTRAYKDKHLKELMRAAGEEDYGGDVKAHCAETVKRDAESEMFSPCEILIDEIRGEASGEESSQKPKVIDNLGMEAYCYERFVTHFPPMSKEKAENWFKKFMQRCSKDNLTLSDIYADVDNLIEIYRTDKNNG